jgi:hypothetical protein
MVVLAAFGRPKTLQCDRGLPRQRRIRGIGRLKALEITALEIKALEIKALEIKALDLQASEIPWRAM